MDFLTFMMHAIARALLNFLLPLDQDEQEPLCENTTFFEELMLVLLHLCVITTVALVIFATVTYLRRTYRWPKSLADCRAASGLSKPAAVQTKTLIPLSYAVALDKKVKKLDDENHCLRKVIRDTINNVKKNMCFGDHVEATALQQKLGDALPLGIDTEKLSSSKPRVTGEGEMGAKEKKAIKRIEDQLAKRRDHLEKTRQAMEKLQAETDIEEDMYTDLNNRVQEMWIRFKETEQKLVKLGSTAAGQIERLEFLESGAGEYSYAETETEEESENEVALPEREPKPKPTPGPEKASDEGTTCAQKTGCAEEAMMVDEDFNFSLLGVSQQSSTGLSESKYTDTPFPSFADYPNMSPSTFS